MGVRSQQRNRSNSMRKPKGKLVALLAGTVVVALVAVGAIFWKDVYCHLFLDARLEGRWKGLISESTRLFAFHSEYVIEFDNIGNVRSEETLWATASRHNDPRRTVSLGTYSIDGNRLDIAWPHGVWSKVYRIEEDTLTLLGSSGTDTIFRRIPDDS